MSSEQYREFEMLIRAWLETPADKRPSPEDLAERVAEIARRQQQQEGNGK